MADDHLSITPSTVRSRAARSTMSTVRQRTSPPPGSDNADGRPPTKRARKAINCEPCRNSKLKCDRQVHCPLSVYYPAHISSETAPAHPVFFEASPVVSPMLELALTCPTGTSAMCYQDGRGPDADPARTDDPQ